MSRSSTDPFPAHPPDRARALPAAGAGARSCAMSASRSRWFSPKMLTSPKTPPIWSSVEIEPLPTIMHATEEPGDLRARPDHRAQRAPQRLWRCRRRLPRRACHRLARAFGRPAQRRADGDPRRHCALRRGARRAGNARRRQGAALEPRRARADARPRAGLGAALRGPCRRRLRHSRRALSRGRAGLRRRAELQAAGQMDRGPARASDRGQSFARADAIACGRRSTRTATSSASTTNFFTTTAPICARTRRPCRTSPPPCCRGPIACRPIARSGTSASPTRRPAAPIARRAATRAPSCASGCWTPSQRRSASTRSRCDDAI